MHLCDDVFSFQLCGLCIFYFHHENLRSRFCLAGPSEVSREQQEEISRVRKPPATESSDAGWCPHLAHGHRADTKILSRGGTTPGTSPGARMPPFPGLTLLSETRVWFACAHGDRTSAPTSSRPGLLGPHGGPAHTQCSDPADTSQQV